MNTQITNLVRPVLRTLKSAGRQKIFCIGRNKTGTTSVAAALREAGIIVAQQEPAARLVQDWARRDFRRLIRFCRTAQAFQDFPFSLPYTFQALDAHFPESKFILTVRDSPEQWYSSLTNSHAKLFGHGRIPTHEDLADAEYIYKGRVLEVNQLVFQTPKDDLYNKDLLITHYNFHCKCVMDYFAHRPGDLLVVNVAKEGDYARFCEFIGIKCEKEQFPWENKTADASVQTSLN